MTCCTKFLEGWCKYQGAVIRFVLFARWQQCFL